MCVMHACVCIVSKRARFYTLVHSTQPCLGGDAKTLMFANVAPTVESAQETLCSLRFAAKVNACEVGQAKRNTAPRVAQ